MKPLHELGIEHKGIEESLVAAVRVDLANRRELPLALADMKRRVPDSAVAGPLFAHWPFLPCGEGFDVWLGVPVTRAVEGVETQRFPAREVLSLVHEGPLEQLRESYGTLFRAATERGLVSDEFTREVYWELATPVYCRIELQLVVHDWSSLLGRGVEWALGAEARGEVMQAAELLTVESTLDQRFEWVRGAIGRLDGLADERVRFESVSRCAHVFPEKPLEKLEAVYKEARTATGDSWQAVDAVLAVMANDRTWFGKPYREGRVIYATKGPANRHAFEAATTDAERRRAACYCTLVRDHLDQGMSPTFCNCSAGWERQVWERVIGRPVRVEVVKSLLRGDLCCQFAVQLPDELNG
jgi:hypothetical protein